MNFENIGLFIDAHSVFFSATILAVAYIFIAIDRIPKVTIAMLGAAIAIILGLLSQNKFDGAVLNSKYFVSYIDFNVLFLLISMMIIVAITTRSGVFTYLANILLKKTRGYPKLVLVALAFFTAFTSAFLDNVTTVILIMPITFAIAKKLNISPIPFLISEIFMSNIGGTATLIGDPPNIIIGSAANLSFMDFIKELTTPIAIVFVAVCSVLVFLFRKILVTTPERMESVCRIDNSNSITDKPLMIRSLVVLGLVILGFITHGVTHLQTSVVASTGAAILLLFEKPDDLFKQVEWSTIFFFTGLFIIIGSLEASGGIKIMADWVLELTKDSQGLTAMIILWASGIISGVIDNIPYTATMTPLVLEIEKVLGADYAYPLWWCLSLGTCLGGNMTIIGAAANVIVSGYSAKEGYKIGFIYFLKYGVLTTFISLIICTVYILIRFQL